MKYTHICWLTFRVHSNFDHVGWLHFDLVEQHSLCETVQGWRRDPFLLLLPSSLFCEGCVDSFLSNAAAVSVVDVFSASFVQIGGEEWTFLFLSLSVSWSLLKWLQGQSPEWMSLFADLHILPNVNQTLCYPEATFSEKASRIWISLWWPMQPRWLSWQRYSKTQTCRNLLLCHRDWFDCRTAPSNRTCTLTVSSHPEFLLTSYSHLFLYREN